MDGVFWSCSIDFSYLIYYFWPCIGQKIHGHLHFFSIIDHFWISEKVDCSATVHHTHFSQILPMFFTCLLPCKLAFNPLQPLVFLLDTLTSVSLSTFFHTLFLLLIGNDCAQFLSCQTTGLLIYYLLSHKYLTYALLNHIDRHFSWFCVCAKLVSFDLSRSPPSFLFYFCVLPLSLLFLL